MASFDTLNYAKWDSLDCSSDDEPQQVRVDPRAQGCATIRSDGSKAYSVQMSTSQGPCVVEEDAVKKATSPSRPNWPGRIHQTKLTCKSRYRVKRRPPRRSLRKRWS